ncbi:MAG: 30S ribosomal protein S17 [Chloroflexi bacterium]|nr:30S ribosomal protein S17 [Chloroflexota bacterium]
MAAKEEKGKSRVGLVVSDKMDKTVIVRVETLRRHRVYKRPTRQWAKFKAHDEGNACKVGDRVRIVETRPLSREKRWRVAEILVHKEMAEIQPSEIV